MTAEPTKQDDGDLEFAIVRVYDAPRAVVYRMWADPGHFAKWCVPDGLDISDQTFDFRPGGGFGSTMTAPDGTTHRPRCVYQEIVENERIVFTHCWLRDDGTTSPKTLVTVAFEDSGAKTRMTLQQTLFASRESRDGHLEGWTQSIDGLAPYLTAQEPTAATQAAS